MGLSDQNTVDFLSLSKDEAEVVLTIADDWQGDDELRHLSLLQDRIKRYLDFCGSGEVWVELARICGRAIARTTPLRIDIVGVRELPGEHGAAFLDHYLRVAREEGVRLTHRVLAS